MRRLPSPSDRARFTYTRSRTLLTCARTIRAVVVHSRRPITAEGRWRMMSTRIPERVSFEGGPSPASPGSLATMLTASLRSFADPRIELEVQEIRDEVEEHDREREEEERSLEHRIVAVD